LGAITVTAQGSGQLEARNTGASYIWHS